MSNVTIYLPDDLAEQIKKADINTSQICQDALKRVLKGKPSLEMVTCEDCSEKIIFDAEHEIFVCSKCGAVHE